MSTEPITAPDHLLVYITVFLSKISNWQISGKTWRDIRFAKFGCKVEKIEEDSLDLISSPSP